MPLYGPNFIERITKIVNEIESHAIEMTVEYTVKEKDKIHTHTQELWTSLIDSFRWVYNIHIYRHYFVNLQL